MVLKKYLFASSFMLVLSSAVFAGNESTAMGARAAGMGGLTSVLKGGWAVANNPAGIGQQKTLFAGAFYENRFLVEELAYQAAAFSHPLGKGAIGLSLGRFGYDLYNENRIGLSYGKQLGENISLGVQLNYLSTSIGENYGSRSAVSGTIGVMAELTKEWSMGAVVVNPNRAELADFDDERYPTLIRLGSAYRFSDKVMMGAEIEKDIDLDAMGRFGLEYHPVEQLYIRAGLATNPSQSTFGFGLLFKDFQLDFASSFHSVLGFTPHIGLSYRPQKKP